jgi:hypothetical protein
MGLSQRVTELLERWLGDGEYLPQIAPWFQPIPTTTKSPTVLVPVDTTANGTIIVDANPDRVSVFIQNQSSQPVLINFGDDVTTLKYCTILTGSSGLRIGDGGSYTSNSWKGSIKGLVEAETADVTIFEEVI